MDRLTSMTVFARVAASRSFSAAARDLGISQATASKHVQTLEDWIGTRLLHRTTRRVGLTEAGESFYAQCTRILEDMETARQVGTPDARIRGTLRFTAPVAFGSALLGPLLVRFTQLYPDLALNVTLVDRPVDLVEEGYDLALQVIHGPLEDARQPGMLLQQLMPMPFEVCAAPSYLAQAGIPERPADLAVHACITDNRHPGNVWRFTSPHGITEEVAIPSRVRADNGVLRREAALAGGGILMAPAFLLADDVAAGRLVRVLPTYRAQEATLCLMCHASRAALPKMRALIGFFTAQFQTEPTASGPASA